MIATYDVIQLNDEVVGASQSEANNDTFSLASLIVEINFFGQPLGPPPTPVILYNLSEILFNDHTP